MTAQAIAHESLSRAVSGNSTANYLPIIAGFMARGIAVDDIKPRENVFTYNAWRALGRQVRRGEHGVKATTFVPVKGKKATEEKPGKDGFKMPRTVTVFHVSQTDPVPESLPECESFDRVGFTIRKGGTINRTLQDDDERAAKDAHRERFQD